MRFSLDRRWATLVVAVLLGAGGGTMLGLLTAPGPSSDAAPALAPIDPGASSTTGRPRSRVAGVSSSTTRARRQGPAAPAPAPTAASTTSTTLAPTTTSTTLAPTTSTLEPTTTSGDPTSSSTTVSSVGPPTAS